MELRMTSHEKALVRSLARSDVFKALQILAQDMVTNWATQGSGKSTEWEFVRDALSREAKIEALDAYFKQIEQLFFDKSL